MDEETYIGYIKYEGPLVENGLMDARKQAKALLAFDSALRFSLQSKRQISGIWILKSLFEFAKDRGKL